MTILLERGMFMYDFKTVYDRKKDGSMKWDCVCESQNCDCLDCFPLTMADMDFQICPKIKDGLSEYIQGHVLGYTMPTQNYLNTVASYLSDRFDFQVDPDWILTTPGVVSAIAAGIRALSEPGQGVIVFSPVYNPFYEQVEYSGRQLIKCPMLIDDTGKYKLDLDLFKKLASDANNRLLIFCSPHNPGGRVWSKEEIQAVSDLCIKHDLHVISDEIHGDLALKGNKHYSFPAVHSEMAQRTIVCSAASKAYNIAGLQCSNIVIANAEIREKFEEALASFGIQQANALGLKATEIAYKDCQDWLEEAKVAVETNHALVVDFFESWGSRWKVMPQEASFMAWINYQEYDILPEDMIHLLCDQCHFYVNDGRMYGPEGEGWIRLNVGLPTEELRGLLKRFKAKFEEKITQL